MNFKDINANEWVQIFLFSLFALIFLQQAWANIIRREISIISIDRIIIFWSENFSGNKNKIETRILSKDSKRLTIQGLIALLAFLGFLREILRLINNNS